MAYRNSKVSDKEKTTGVQQGKTIATNIQQIGSSSKNCDTKSTP